MENESIGSVVESQVDATPNTDGIEGFSNDPLFQELSKAVDGYGILAKNNDEEADPENAALPSEITDSPAMGKEEKVIPSDDTEKAEKFAQGEKTEQPKEQPSQTFEIDGHVLTIDKVYDLAKGYHERAKAQYEEYQQFQQEKSKYDEMKSSPEMVILEHMKNNSAFLERVMEIAPEFVDGVHSEYQAEQLKGTDAKLQERIDRLEKMLIERETRERETVQQAQIRQQQESTQRLFEDVDKHALDKAQKLGIPTEELQELAHVALARLNLPEGNPNKLALTKESLVKFFDSSLERKAGYINSIKQGARGTYLSEKKSAPVPPAASGNTPRISPNQSKELGAAKVAEVESDLLKAFGKLK